MKKPFKPENEDEMLYGWALAYEYRTYPDYDKDDLFQEARQIAHVAATTRTFDNQVHYCSYVRRCFYNRVIDLAAGRNRKGHGLTPTFSYLDGPDHQVVAPAASDPLTEFARALGEAPEALDRLVRMFCSEDGERRPGAPRPARQKDPERQNAYLCSLLGLDPGTNDLIGMMSRWLSGDRQVA